jgi:O-methyltransferase
MKITKLIIQNKIMLKLVRYIWKIIKPFRLYFFNLFCLKNYLTIDEKEIFFDTTDPIRYATIFLMIRQIQRKGIKGSFAELGVYKGQTSKILHTLAPERTLFLFDTFDGFPKQDYSGKQVTYFKDTSIDIVIKTIGNRNNIIFKKGYFPLTTNGLEKHKFAFVILDADLYKPTLSGLTFFYPRMNPGGYILIHDYNCESWNSATKKAVIKFFKDKPEPLIEIPDKEGSVMVCKI